jgi:hypothetical protein
MEFRVTVASGPWLLASLFCRDHADVRPLWQRGDSLKGEFLAQDTYRKTTKGALA